jgi:hypothetical protein
MILLIEKRVFIVKYVFLEGNRYTDLVQEQFAEKFPEKPAPHRNAVRRLNEKFRETGSVLDAITAYIKKISQEDLLKVCANKIKRVQACIDARGHHFQQLL